MPSNIEIKARVKNLGELKAVAEVIATEPLQILQQEDVFFRVPNGRLKLRSFGDGMGELIQYERPDTLHSKKSDYQLFPTANPEELRQMLARALGEVVTVKKRREVYLVGQTRIHLDQVEGLGEFLELEVVLAEGQDDDDGREIARQLMDLLGVKKDALVSCAYADLLLGAPNKME